MNAAPKVDIRALLLIALDEAPPPGLPDRVMARVAALTTIVEFVRLIAAAPAAIFLPPAEGNDADDDASDPSNSQ